MRIMDSIDKKLQICFKQILTPVHALGDVVLDPLQFVEDIDRRLLISFGRVFQEAESALKLQCLIVVADETCGDRIVEWDILQAIENLVRPKDSVPYRENEKVC